MAAIDKIYVSEFYEYDTIMRWSLIYYPKLLNYFYDIHLGYKDFKEMREKSVEYNKSIINRELEKIGGKDVSFDDAVENLRQHYKKSANYDASDGQLKSEVKMILDMASKTDDEILDTFFRYPVTNTPLSVDRKLKWICPIPIVRRYLQSQCGVNKKWEWFYRLFWRGKKYFS